VTEVMRIGRKEYLTTICNGARNITEASADGLDRHSGTGDELRGSHDESSRCAATCQDFHTA